MPSYDVTAEASPSPAHPQGGSGGSPDSSPDSSPQVNNSPIEYNLNLSSQSPSQYLLVDSGCTTHIDNDATNFSHFNESFKPENHLIKFADGRQPPGIVQGVGNVKQGLQSSDGEMCQVNMTDSLYIPSFQQPIMSVWKAVNNGCSVHFTPQGHSLVNPSGKIFDIVENNKLYFLPRFSPDIQDVHAINENPSLKESKASHSLHKWHQILGHVNCEHLKQLEAHVYGMHINDKQLFNCSTCTLTKMTNDRNRKLNPKASQILEVVHTDIVGPISPVSLGGFRYGLSFVDDYSGMIHIYLMKKKSDPLYATKKYLADTARYGSIKVLRSDNGSEYTSNEFRSLMIDNKIKQEFSAPYSPHQNGTVERSHRIVFEMARALLIEAQLPQHMWNYAAKTAVFIRNRCYNPRLMKTPIEAFTG